MAAVELPDQIGEVKMGDEKNHEIDLRTLYDLAPQRAWKELQEVTERLFVQLGQAKCISIAIHYVESYLPKFEYYYPEKTWPHELLKGIRATISARTGEKTWPGAFAEFTEDYSKPGAGNFRDALLELWRIGTVRDDPTQCAQLARLSICNVFMAELDESWGRRNPDLWERKRHPVTTYDMFILPRDFWASPEVSERDVNNWLGLGDEIKKRFREHD